jgi:hypothetical protein
LQRVPVLQGASASGTGRLFLGLASKNFGHSVNCLTLGRRTYRQAQRDAEGIQMLAKIIAAVVTIGLIWSVAAMSDLVPVVLAE